MISLMKWHNNSATINDMGRLRGKIFYQSGERPRIVSRVEWFDDQQRVRFVDYYSKNGIKFAQTVYDLNRKAILKKYLTAEGKEVIYENFVTSRYWLKLYQILSFTSLLLQRCLIS